MTSKWVLGAVLTVLAAAPAGADPSVVTLAGGTYQLNEPLSTTFSNVGVTSDGNTRAGNVDGFGYSYSAEALAVDGITPGAPVRTHGVTFTWPTASPGSPNNTLAAGQTVGVYGSSSTLGFLLTSTYPTSGKGTVNYTDGSTQEYTIGSPNWAGDLPPGVFPVITMPYRNGPNGRDDRPVHIFYAGVPLASAKTVKSVRLPDIGSDTDIPAMHIFAVALGDKPNLAQGKIATQSSDAWGGPAARVVDGDSNGVWNNNSVSHTDIQDNTWWQVDLGATSPLSQVNVWNRVDCCPERLDDFWIFVSAAPFDTSLTPAQQAAKPGVWSAHQTGRAPLVTTVRPNVPGRYVMVQLAGRNYLSLAEVEVFGQQPTAEDWVGTWGAAQGGPATWASNGFPDCALRNIVHTSVGGTEARIRFSNRFGTGPLELRTTSVAIRGADGRADAVPGSMRQVTFAGRKSVTIPAGGEVVSDPVAMTIPADTDLLVTTYTPRGAQGPATYHPSANQISWLTEPGEDYTMEESGARYTRELGSWLYVEEIDVRGSGAKGTVVTFGDSITDGGYTTTNSNHRWPDLLADRTKDFGVLNSGLSANRLMRDGEDPAWGRSGIARIDDDIINRTGVRTVILLQGINDMIHDPRTKDPALFAAGYREFVARLRAKGIKVIGATVTPIKGWSGYDSQLEQTRQGINEFIRTGGVFDAVADFDKAIQDPADPMKIKAEYDAGDHLHPSDAGNSALAAAVDLGKL